MGLGLGENAASAHSRRTPGVGIISQEPPSCPSPISHQPTCPWPPRSPLGPHPAHSRLLPLGASGSSMKWGS